MITYKEYIEFNERYEKQKREIKKRLDLIKSGVSFGYPDPYDMDNYFPCNYIKTIDEVDGIIQVIEPGLNTITEDSVFAFVFDEK